MLAFLFFGCRGGLVYPKMSERVCVARYDWHVNKAKRKLTSPLSLKQFQGVRKWMLKSPSMTN